MIRSIIPRDEIFFDKFDKICKLMVEAAEDLKEMLAGEEFHETQAQRIKALESESDEQVHHALEHLHRTFVTPLDRQDILKLASRLDDIIDYTEAASSRLVLYRPKRIREEARRLADVLVRSAKQVAEMIGLLRNLKKNGQHILQLAVEVDRLENEADQVHRKAIASLFSEEQDDRELIKWRDILAHIEDATDCCEDVTDVVEGIVLEYT